jgi:hypothetical protein
MGRIVYCPIPSVSVTTDSDQDIFQLTAGSANKIKLHAFELYSAAIAAEAVALRLVRRTTDGSGTAQTEVKADEDDGTITGALATLQTAPGTLGDVLAHFHWEQLGPLVFLPTPELRPMVQEGGRIAVNLQTALAGTTVWSGWVAWEEI